MSLGHKIDGKFVVQMLAEHSGMTWPELSDLFGQGSSGAMQLYWCLNELAEVGLINLDNVGSANQPKSAIQPEPNSPSAEQIKMYIERCLTDSSFEATNKIRASNLWYKTQAALTRVYSHDRGIPDKFEMLVHPIFGNPSAPVEPMSIFVVMPFNEQLKDVYEIYIKEVATSLNLSVARADDFFTSNMIMNDIWRAICAATVLIAECTGKNPNVFYEMGIAHTVGKSLILITQDEQDVPSDLRHMRYIKYEYTPPGMKLFQQTLHKTIVDIMRIT